MQTVLEVFFIFLKLGLTSFGGPIAHLGYFHDEFVKRRQWIDEHAYTDLVALCQFLPGPASSQVGISLGFSRAGFMGAIAAWLGFTLPSAILLILFGLGITKFSTYIQGSWLHGLKIAAVAVVAQAIWAMGTKLCPDKPRITIALLAAMAATLVSASIGQIIVILSGGLAGWLFLKPTSDLPHTPIKADVSRFAGGLCLSSFFLFLIFLPALASWTESHTLRLFDGFFRAGSLVFGGGHVVLPLLQAEVVRNGWVSNETFMAGYGAAQAIPGPLFTFTAYLGAVSNLEPSGWPGAFFCLIAAFMPSFLLIIGALPYWEQLRQIHGVRRAMLGINAAVVGLLISAFFHPVWSSAIFSLKDLCLAIASLFLIIHWKAPSWMVVLICGFVGGLLL